MAVASSGYKAYHSNSPSKNETPSPIRNLPTEIVAEVLTGLDSSSLSSALLAHRLFWETFQGCQRQILREIVTRLIPPQLLPLASVTYEASLIDYSDWNRSRRLLDQLHYLHNNQAPASASSASSPPPWQWPLTRRVTAAMERVHLMVKHFAADFAQRTIPRFSHIFQATRPETCTPSEELRILRAFYRFQLYCNIFGRKALESAREAVCGREYDWESQQLVGQKSDEDVQGELQAFFWVWPPWVNEQLACIFEYLETRLSGFFDEVAAHDVEWGYRRVDWIEPTVAISHRRFLVSTIPFLNCHISISILKAFQADRFTAI
ncbi:hypothetical protein C8A03DRAFT_12434 [Achaetomium macrosporum]|uniref:F-box domain-containing protein n=1 Tax=Achaetomium macrosporum TaxID=79813 RepID=A0AAN7CGN7_9PEZI|nr:hypothetical protein C8A03DRAFT_12434 [Achaetomium macrosporum]